MKSSRNLWLALAAACSFSLIAPAQTTAPATSQAPAAAGRPQGPTPTPSPTPVPVDPTVAAPKTGPNGQAFLDKHKQFLERGKSGPIGVLFLGDSITAGWANAPAIWEQFYGRFQPANFGIGGDQTQHVLWRITSGELENIKPRLVVLMIGTNNTGANTAAQIAAADKKIVQTIRTKLPNTKILLLGIFPRGPRKDKAGVVTDDGVSRMAIITEVNKELARLDDKKMIRYLDLTKAFLNKEGKIPDSVMPDQLHPNVRGYEIWAKAMNPLFLEMLGEKPSPLPVASPDN